MRPILLLLPLLLLPLLLPAGDADPAYPCWRGNDGSGSGVDCGRPLIEDFGQRKLLWKSETDDIWSGYAFLGGGSCAGPVVAEEKVYLNYNRPSGEIICEKYFERLWPMKKNKYGLTEEQVRDRTRINADDILVCLDGRTGKELWRNVGKERGINRGMQVRGKPPQKTGPHSLPAVAYGKVLHVGNLGWVYCCDATTGTLLWELDWQPEKLKAKKAELLKNRGMPNLDRMDFCTSPTFAGGVFVVPRGSGGSTLVGVDPATGKERWSVKAGGKESAPVRWLHGGKEYIVCGGVAIDPASGKELWRQDIVHSAGSVCVGEGHLVATGSRGDKRKPGTAKGLTGYRIGPTGIEQVWQVDAKYRSEGHCTPVIHRGHVYCKVAAEQRGQSQFVCIELATGKVIGTTEPRRTDACGSMIAADGMLYYEMFWVNAAPEHFALSGPSQGPQGDQTVDNCASHTPAIVNGVIFMRGQNRVYAYDLRR